MVKRECIRLGVCAIVGLILGIIIPVSNKSWLFIITSPFYGIGTFYGIKLILTMLGGIGKTAGKSVFSSISGGHWGGLFLVIVLMVVSMGLVLTFGWIIGAFAAGKALFDAYRIDSEIGGSSKSSYNDSWDTGSSTSRGSKKNKSNQNDDYDNMSW